MPSPLNTPPIGMLAPIPIPPFSNSRRIQQRQRYPSRTAVDTSNEVISAINLLSASLSSPLTDMTQSPAPYKTDNPHHLQPVTINRLHDRVYHASTRFCRLKKGRGVHNEVFDDAYTSHDLRLGMLDQDINNHGYIGVAPPRMVDAAMISLPQQAGTAQLLDVLPPHLRAVYATPSLLLQPPATKLVNRRAFMCSDGEYVALIRRMLTNDMISFTQRPMAVNGLFAVDKDGGVSQRLIIDARCVNSMMIPSPPVSLPTPDLIASMNVPQGTTLYAAKIDLCNFYHRLRLPQQWWRWFALPSLRVGDLGVSINGYDDDDIVYPCCTTLPMGWSHSVFLAQAIHEHIIDSRVPLLQRCDRIIRAPYDQLSSSNVCVLLKVGTRGHVYEEAPLCTSLLASPIGDYNITRMRHSIYIDDLNLYHTDPIAMSLAMDEYMVVMASIGLPAKPSKVVRPTADGVECLGVWVHGRTAEVGVSVPKLQVLRASTQRLLDIGYCSGRDLAHIVGRWNWSFLIRRPAMAVFSAVYRFIESAHNARYMIWPSVRRELWTVLRLAPLLYASINTNWSPIIIASDASELASGVVFADVGVAAVSEVAAMPSSPGIAPPPSLVSFVRRVKWKTAISHKWRDEEHINALEMRATLAAVRWSLKHPSILVPSSHDHIKLMVLCDSSAVVGSTNKGRTSAHRLLRPLRMIAALLLVAGIYVSLKWIPTALNPADAPSRLQ